MHTGAELRFGAKCGLWLQCGADGGYWAGVVSGQHGSQRGFVGLVVDLDRELGRVEQSVQEFGRRTVQVDHKVWQRVQGAGLSRPIAHRVGYRIAGTTVTWWVNAVSGTGEKVSTGMTATTVDCPAGGWCRYGGATAPSGTSRAMRRRSPRLGWRPGGVATGRPHAELVAVRIRQHDGAVVAGAEPSGAEGDQRVNRRPLVAVRREQFEALPVRLRFRRHGRAIPCVPCDFRAAAR